MGRLVSEKLINDGHQVNIFDLPQANYEGFDNSRTKIFKGNLNDSSILHCVWFCNHIGYRGISILCELSLCNSLVHFGCGFVFTLFTGVPRFFAIWFFKFSLSVVLYSHWLLVYHDSLQFVSTWFITFGMCVGLNSHWLHGYHNYSLDVYMWFFKFTSFMFYIHIVYCIFSQ